MNFNPERFSMQKQKINMMKIPAAIIEDPSLSLIPGFHNMLEHRRQNIFRISKGNFIS
jgi:hypothetical protein